MGQLNYYEVLEITETASLEVVKAAYRALAKKYHPDTYEGSELDREKNMAQINEAYDTLSDSKKRDQYDEKLKSQKSFSKQFVDEQKSRNNRKDMYNDFVDNNTTYKEQQSDYSQDKVYSENEVENGKVGWFGNMVRGVGKEMVKSMQKKSQEVENAYLSGLIMDDYLLVKSFKQASGYKRVGYSKALEEKGLLERNYQGKLVPTYRFKQFF